MDQTMTRILPRTVDLAGQTFGYWKVQNTYEIKDGRRKWECVCECGTIRLVEENNLLYGKSRICGCLSRQNRAKDLTGRVFGRLTVLRRAPNRRNRVYWECRCTCGNLSTVAAHELTQGKTQSCGCLRAEKTSAQDLTGQVYGRLTAIEPTEKRDKKGSVIWRCVCECGAQTETTQDMLASGRTVSCGCRKQEIAQQLPNRLHFVDGTCIEFLEKRKQRGDNSSGGTGVYQRKDGKYRASIGFKGKRYDLGAYDTFDEAVKAREKAEQAFHKAFVEEYLSSTINHS